MRSSKAKRTVKAVKTPPRVVLTPDALFKAVLVNEPVTLIELIKEPNMLQHPKAINS